ncbi:unnamed protein product [Spodoptera littoralis]|uniref:Cuticular protein n=1 Tax=Spodoptera littoralis TaxID=7109 RepID=A0A9P0MWQ0_SPOLI|nr:unnamed protein product [Spodoptera littoralis]CAH1636168.1 unnamed protein product [Spodoptera littoralis]
MANTALYILLAATAVAAVQVNFVPPAATSYIYRSDNNGPATYIKLGAPALPHHTAHSSYVPHLPVLQPKFQAIEAIDLAPVPLPYLAAKPIVVEDAEESDDDDDDDDDSESSEEYGGDDYGHAFAKGGGSNYGEKHHSAHGEKGSKGYHTEDHHAKGEAGNYGKKHDEGYYKEAEGGEKGHHDVAAVHGKHYEGGKSYKGGDHGHKKHFSKGEDITGYHKVFHKDEFKKDHDFYDVADKSGHFNKHGHENEHHGSEEGGHEEGGHHDSASNKGGFGKSGFHAKGHIDDADASHSAEDGHESHYHNKADFGKKGGSSHGQEFAFANDDDEDDDDDSHYDDKE